MSASDGTHVEVREKEIAAAKEEVAAAKAELAEAKERRVKAEDVLRKAQEVDPVDAQRVAEAKLGVAKAEWQAAPDSVKDVFLASVKTAQESVKTAQEIAKTANMAYNTALNAPTAALQHGAAGGAQAASEQGLLLQAIQNLSLEQKKYYQNIESQLQSAATEEMSMSDANEEFSKPLLQDLHMNWARAADNTDDGTNPHFAWEGGEDRNTSRAIQELERRMGSFDVENDDRQVEFVDVHKKRFLPLKAGGKKADGQTDAAICFSALQHDDQSCFAWILSGVEFKTNTAPLRLFQLILELVAISIMSAFGQGIVVLGTDLNTKWEVLFFDSTNHITVQAFRSGSVALAFVKEKLKSVHSRVAQLQPLPQIQEGVWLEDSMGIDQDLRGFGVDAESEHDRLQDLQNFAQYLNQRFDANVTLPLWAQGPDVRGILA